MQNIIVNRVDQGEFVLIAEIGVNYYDIAHKYDITPIDAAKIMVKEANDSGVHAVKFQTYKADTLAAKNSPSYWDTNEETTTSQYELFKKYDHFTYTEYKELADYCSEIGIEFLSTAFDTESADYLYDLMNVYKISSSDLNNTPFVEYQAKKNKPILLSVGASNEEEIDKTINTIKKFNNNQIILMHCVLEYPTPFKNANLNRIASLKEKYPDLVIGYSDHAKPDYDADVIKTAYNLGAKVIEKHFTLDKNLPGNDHYHAMDQHDAKKIIDGISFIDDIRGSYKIKYSKSEEVSRQNARRSLVTTRIISKGEKITSDMITYKRPGTGVSPSELYSIVGKTSKRTINEDTILQYDMFE